MQNKGHHVELQPSYSINSTKALNSKQNGGFKIAESGLPKTKIMQHTGAHFVKELTENPSSRIETILTTE